MLLVSYLPIVLNIIFVIFTLLTPAIVFSRWISIYLGVAALVILYAVVLIIRALITDREGSWFLMSTIWIGVLLVWLRYRRVSKFFLLQHRFSKHRLRSHIYPHNNSFAFSPGYFQNQNKGKGFSYL